MVMVATEVPLQHSVQRSTIESLTNTFDKDYGHCIIIENNRFSIKRSFFKEGLGIPSVEELKFEGNRFAMGAPTEDGYRLAKEFSII